MRDLLGTSATPADAFVVDTAYGGFETNGTTSVSEADLETFRDAAESLASSVDIESLAACPGSGAPTGGATSVQHVCGTSAENASATIACPPGSVVTAVEFASYGTPTGTCGAFQAGACAADVKSAVAAACVGKPSCSVLASNALVAAGDPCQNTPKSLSVQVTCASSGGGSTVSVADGPGCARAFIQNFGTRIFRRPPTSEQVDALMALYTEKAGRSDVGSALRLVLSAMLQAPSFLYRAEPAITRAGPAPLDPYSLASRLSYMLWQSTPDAELLARAADVTLTDRKVLEGQANRLMADPRFTDGVRSFYRQWLALSKLDTMDKDTKAFPAFTTSMRASMKEETLRFIDDLYQQPKPTFEALMTASYTFVNADLAPLYGVSAPGDGWTKATLPGGQRSGLLTQAGLLSVTSSADQTSPIRRGLFIRRQVLCDVVPNPPPNVPPAPVVDPNVPIRDRLAQHRVNATCNSCHALLDPVGLGFEHYDAIGRWRDMDGKFPVDASGQLDASGDPTIDGAFNGASDLGAKLAHSTQAQACITKQWFRYAVGRPEDAGESCAVDSLVKGFSTSGGDLKALLLDVVRSDVFTKTTGSPN